MITRVQYSVNTRNNVTFGNAASKGFTKGKAVMKAAIPVNDKTGFWTRLIDMFFEVFPGLDAQFRKQMSKMNQVDRLI